LRMGNVGRRLDQCPLEIIALELKLAYQLGLRGAQPSR
jgi:hypothetical protein